MIQWRDHITSDPQILHGAVCIRGTRIPVSVVLANLAAGASPDDLLKSYPTLTPEAIQAALAYAAVLAEDHVVDLPSTSDGQAA